MKLISGHVFRASFSVFFHTDCEIETQRIWRVANKPSSGKQEICWHKQSQSEHRKHPYLLAVMQLLYKTSYEQFSRTVLHLLPKPLAWCCNFHSPILVSSDTAAIQNILWTIHSYCLTFFCQNHSLDAVVTFIFPYLLAVIQLLYNTFYVRFTRSI